MKRILGILFVLIFALAFVAVYCYLNNQKYILRKEIKHKIIAGIDKKDLVYFAFSKFDSERNLKWEHSKEFEYNGEMYDVVEKRTIGDTIYFWCWWDHEETKLNKQLNELVSLAMGTSQKNNDNNKRLLDFYKSLFYSDPIPFDLYDNGSNENLPIYNFRYQSVNFPPPIPPPNYC